MITSIRNCCFALVICTISALAAAEAPPGYYNAAQGLRGAGLEAALRNIIDGHTSLSYNGAKDRLWDTVEPQAGVITCIYSGRTTTNLNRDTDGMNAEHTWPQSRGAGSTPPRSDLHHLFVTDATWNSRRGSYRFQNVTNPSNTSPIGAKVNSSQGFEPPDAYKGDVARVIFYFAVRYNREVRNGAFLTGSDGSTADDHMGELDDLIAWHFADPPSQYERNRNDRIYAIQGNRNPFIDNPDFLTDWLELGPPAPSIATVTSPAVPDFANATHLRATITSTIPVNASTVKAHWRLGMAGDFTTTPMTLVSGNATAGTWQTTTAIPAQPGGTRVEYFVEAADTDANAARDPEAGTLSFIVFEPGAPVVLAATQPAAPRVGDAITITATITSEQGMDPAKVTAVYTTSDGRSGENPMTLMAGTLSNGSWQANISITGLGVGQTLSYAVAASDTQGRSDRDPDVGFRTVTVLPVPTELNIAGYTLRETDANITLVFPANTIVQANGFVIVGRQASKAQFETVWGALPANAVYINAHDIIGGNGMVINGGEIFTLDDAQGTRLDGPTPTTALSASNARVYRTATDANTWARNADPSSANPGVLEFPGTGAGLIITEFCDPAGSFIESFVELYFDAPAAPVPSYGDLMMLY